MHEPLVGCLMAWDVLGIKLTSDSPKMGPTMTTFKRAYMRVHIWSQEGIRVDVFTCPESLHGISYEFGESDVG